MSSTEFRDTLNKPTASLIADVVKFDKPKAMDLQAKLLAIHKAEADQPREAQQDLYGIRDEGKLGTALKKAGVSADDITAARAEVESEKGMPRAVPMLGMVATSFRLVSNDIKNALMTAQAGERALRAGELMGGMRADAMPAPAENILTGIVVDGRNPDEPARGFIGKFKDDPAHLVGAQAVHHLADMASAATAMGSAPKEAELKQAANDIGVLARRALIGAGDALSATGQHGPAEKTYGILGSASDADEPAALNRLQAYTQAQISKLEAKGTIDADLAERWSTLAAKRADQAAPVMQVGRAPTTDNGPRPGQKPGS